MNDVCVYYGKIYISDEAYRYGCTIAQDTCRVDECRMMEDGVELFSKMWGVKLEVEEDDNGHSI